MNEIIAKEIAEAKMEEDEIKEMKTEPPSWMTDDTPVTKIQQDEFEAFIDAEIQIICAANRPDLLPDRKQRRFNWIRRRHAPISWVSNYLIPTVWEKIVTRLNKDRSEQEGYPLREIFDDDQFDKNQKICRYVLWAPTGYVRLELDCSTKQVVSIKWLKKKSDEKGEN